MDVLGVYESDDDAVSVDTKGSDGVKRGKGKKRAGPGASSRKAAPVPSDPAGHKDAPVNGTKKTGNTPIPSQNNYKHADVNTMNMEVLDSAGSLSSRIHSSYYKANLLKTPEGDKTKEKAKRQDIAIPSANSGAVLAVQLGTRNNSTGELCISGSEADGKQIKEDNKKEAERREFVATARMKSSLHEHTRKADDMLMANYPVDHPMHKVVSEKAKNAIEIYGKKGKSMMVMNAESVGGVFVTPCGMTEKTYFDEASFDEQLRLGDMHVALAHHSDITSKRRRRLTAEEVEGEEVFGPWIPYEEAELPVADVSVVEALESAKKPKIPNFETNNRKMSHAGLAFPSCAPDIALPLNEVVIEDGKMETKYDGLVVSTLHKKVESDITPIKSFLLPPKNLKVVDPENHKTFLPKKEIHTYAGHSMAVQAIRYIPKTGHCLLSASMDGFVKIWDANNNRKCLRTYKGHCKGVRDISFSNDEGTKFYSCGYDSTIIQWDTEYGKVIGAYAMDSTPFCVTVYPKDENVFIVGSSNKKACQFDARTGNISLEYSAHQSNVNTFTFFEGDRKAVSTGDDKRVVVWEYNIPVPIKQISDPSMHNMPAVIVHPSEKFILAQAMSNQILVYESSASRFRFFGGKRFKGHICGGYAVKPTCSPDGKYVVSGDARGRVYLWDWKTCRNLATLEGHKSVTMDCKWHPIQPSRLATCSWDGTIKLWD